MITELDKQKRAKEYLDKLAEGIDPLTHEPLPQDTVLNNVRLARCFFYVSRREWLIPASVQRRSLIKPENFRRA
jgi:hypothetical protein